MNIITINELWNTDKTESFCQWVLITKETYSLYNQTYGTWSYFSIKQFDRNRESVYKIIWKRRSNA